MANGTLTYQIGGSLVSNGVTMPIVTEAYELEVGEAMQRAIATAPQAAEAALVLGAVSAPVAGFFRNLDDTNFFDVLAGSGGDVITRVQPGQAPFVLLDPTVAPYVLADTADVLFEYVLFDEAAVIP